MIADEVLKLTRERLQSILARRCEPVGCPPGHEQRRAPRWPVGGLVELWMPGLPGSGAAYGTCRDISESGLGVNCTRSFEIGARVDLAFHLPDTALHGAGIVRHCAPAERGYDVGIEFDLAT